MSIPHIAWEAALDGSRLLATTGLRAHLIGVRVASPQVARRFNALRERIKRKVVLGLPDGKMAWFTRRFPLKPYPTVDPFAEADFPGYHPHPLAFSLAADEQGRVVLVNSYPVRFVFEPDGPGPSSEPEAGFVQQFHTLLVDDQGATLLGTFPLGGSFSLVHPGDSFTAEAGALVIGLDTALATAPPPEPLSREEHVVRADTLDPDPEPDDDRSLWEPEDWDEFYARYAGAEEREAV